jgi:hypothetical protein
VLCALCGERSYMSFHRGGEDAAIAESSYCSF